jgi:ribose 5-phosphate isomerase A
MVVIADSTKKVGVLGRFPLPIEIVDFGAVSIARSLEEAIRSAGCVGELRPRRDRDGHPFITDHGHVLLDAHLGRIPDPAALASAISEVPGVVEHGLFIGLASRAVLAGAEGIVVLDRQS